MKQQKPIDDHLQLLIETLLDKSAREDERGDAAIDLGQLKNPIALEALTKIASNPEEDDVIVDNCAESIAEIFVYTNKFDNELFNRLNQFAKEIVFNFIMAKNPNLIDENTKIFFNTGLK